MNRLRIADEHRAGRHPATGAKARPRHRTGTRIVAGVLVALTAWGAAGTSRARADATLDPGGAARTTAADRPTVILPVWALLDGDTPVAGAGVRVYAMRQRTNGKPGRHRLLRPLNRVAEQRTYDSGVALLEFASLPRAFVVVVSGGQAEGRTLRGSMSARVRAYRSAAVVHVTPVTTLVDQWEHDEPGINRARARVTVYRALGIPRWADAADLRATDRWFDGAVFLEREHGRLDRAFPALLSEIRSGASMRFRPAALEEAGGAEGIHDEGIPAENPIAQWWNDLDVTKLIADGFTDLGLSLLKSGVDAGGKWLLGKLLDEWGLKPVKDFLLPKSDTQVIIEILGSLNKRVVELQIIVESVKQAVAESQYAQLVALTNPQTAAIDQLTEDLAAIANTPPENPQRVNYSRDVVRRIGQQLFDPNVAAVLNKALNNPAPDGNDILKAASQVHGTRRWFTAQSSARIKAVQDYFALYQFRLAVLLTNYWSTQPDTYSPATVQRYIDVIHANIDAQRRERLKPPIPDDKFIDTRTMTMWDRKPAWVSGQQYKPDQGRCHCPANVPVYCDRTDPNWQERAKDLGTLEDFKRLIDGWDLENKCATAKGSPAPCSDPLEYLRKEVGLVTSAPGGTPQDWVGYMWLGPDPVPPVRFNPFHGCGYNLITRIDLGAGEKPGPKIFQNWLYDRDPDKYFAHAMSRQAVAPGTYWWPLGGR